VGEASWQNRAVLARTAVLLAFPVALLAGCGNTRTRPPDISHAAVPHGTHNVAFAASGVRFRAPSDWATLGGQAPLVATVASGPALAALWRYPRSEPLPVTNTALSKARLRLLEAARARDSGLQVIRSKLITLDGAPAIELDAVERISGHARRVRSLHVFAFGAELVLDEYAPPNVFHAVDHDVFSPLKRSLRLFPAGAA
jgi:hypothetical protein